MRTEDPSQWGFIGVVGIIPTCGDALSDKGGLVHYYPAACCGPLSSR